MIKIGIQAMLEHPIKAGLDVVALVAIIGAWADHLPAVAALLGAVWYLIQIYDWFCSKLGGKDD